MANTLSPDSDDQQFSTDITIPRQRFLWNESVNGVGEWLLVPAGIGDLLLSVEPASGTARVEYTQDNVAAVLAGSAVGKGWPEGDVAAYSDSVIANAVTAVRCVSTAATTFKVSA